MKYVSIDLETSGLNPDKHQILEFAAIVEDTENQKSFETIPKFEAIINHHEIIGSPVALSMNARILQILSDYKKARDQNERDQIKEQNNIMDLTELGIKFHEFLFRHYVGSNEEYIPIRQKLPRGVLPTPPIKIICAGKNFGTFDLRFLKASHLVEMNQLVIFSQRIMDPSVLYIEKKNDKAPPSLDECKKRAGIEGEVTHKAVEDAWDVVELFRKRL